MSWQDPRLWAALVSIEGLGNKTLANVLSHMRRLELSAENVWSNASLVPSFAANHRLAENFRQFQSRFSLNGYTEWLAERDIQVLTAAEAKYPELLVQVPDRPLVLFVKGGRLSSISRPVAVVGTRRVSPYGRFAVEKLVTELVSLGSTIVSGFMYGIDVLAHQHAVKANGKTIGVLGFGFESMYPRSQTKLFDEMVAQGQTFITEYAPWVSPSKGTFVARNRIVAGLSSAVMVVEAAAKSGSLITAQLALEYGREVLAVPGPISNPQSQGTTWLLNQGATLVTSGRQLYDALGWQLGEDKGMPTSYPSFKSAEAGTDTLSKNIYNELRSMPQSADQLQLSLAKPMNQILTALSMMEVAGWLKRTGDVWIVNTRSCQGVA